MAGAGCAVAGRGRRSYQDLDDQRARERGNDGVRYGHILDPQTGWPVSDAPRSVTILADSCAEAGFLATLGMLHGAGAEAFLDGECVEYRCVR